MGDPVLRQRVRGASNGGDRTPPGAAAAIDYSTDAPATPRAAPGAAPGRPLALREPRRSTPLVRRGRHGGLRAHHPPHRPAAGLGRDDLHRQRPRAPSRLQPGDGGDALGSVLPDRGILRRVRRVAHRGAAPVRAGRVGQRGAPVRPRAACQRRSARGAGGEPPVRRLGPVPALRARVSTLLPQHPAEPHPPARLPPSRSAACRHRLRSGRGAALPHPSVAGARDPGRPLCLVAASALPDQPPEAVAMPAIRRRAHPALGAPVPVRLGRELAAALERRRAARAAVAVHRRDGRRGARRRLARARTARMETPARGRAQLARARGDAPGQLCAAHSAPLERRPALGLRAALRLCRAAAGRRRDGNPRGARLPRPSRDHGRGARLAGAHPSRWKRDPLAPFSGSRPPGRSAERAHAARRGRQGAADGVARLLARALGDLARDRLDDRRVPAPPRDAGRPCDHELRLGAALFLHGPSPGPQGPPRVRDLPGGAASGPPRLRVRGRRRALAGVALALGGLPRLRVRSRAAQPRGRRRSPGPDGVVSRHDLGEPPRARLPPLSGARLPVSARQGVPPARAPPRGRDLPRRGGGHRATPLRRRGCGSRARGSA